MIEVGVQQMLAPAAVQVHVPDDPGLVKQVKQCRQGFPVPAAAELFAQVVVGVASGEARLFDQCGSGDQFGLGMEGFEFHINNIDQL